LGVRTKPPPRGGRFQETGNEAELFRALPAGSVTSNGFVTVTGVRLEGA
jgi:hypothetical protein